jgi:hypothetical protein
MHWMTRATEDALRTRARASRSTPRLRSGALVLAMATLFALPASAQAASYVVNSIGDAPDATLDGTCATAGSVCTLRAALQESNNSASHDTIAFALPNPSTIDLTGVLPFDFDADITGPGSTALTVRRSSGGNYRIITVAGDLRISGLTVTNGHDDGVGGGLGPVAIGGGILNAAHLVLDDVTVTGNTADFASAVVNAPAIGGGIGNTGTLTVTRSTISHNSAVATASGASNAASGVGGGIGSADLGAGAPSLDVTASTIDHNTVTAAAPIEAGAGGGGIAVGAARPR